MSERDETIQSKNDPAIVSPMQLKAKLKPANVVHFRVTNNLFIVELKEWADPTTLTSLTIFITT